MISDPLKRNERTEHASCVALAFLDGVNPVLFSVHKGRTQRGFIALESQKNFLDGSMYELKPLRLLRLFGFFELYGTTK